MNKYKKSRKIRRYEDLVEDYDERIKVYEKDITKKKRILKISRGFCVYFKREYEVLYNEYIELIVDRYILNKYLLIIIKLEYLLEVNLGVDMYKKICKYINKMPIDYRKKLVIIKRDLYKQREVKLGKMEIKFLKNEFKKRVFKKRYLE